MTVEEYMEQRVDDQLNWFERKSSWNQKKFKGYRTGVIGFSVLIPFLTGFIDKEWGHYFQYIVGALGVSIAFFEGVMSLNKYQENWAQYRATAESLKREKMLYETQSGKYEKQENPFHMFVLEVETLLKEENSKWAEYVREKEASAQKQP